jgi:threonine/homoserine/homoserine lactone efflux protein
MPVAFSLNVDMDNMKLCALFFVVATLTLFNPGPGVVMTLTNAMRHGVGGAVGDIFEIAFGALVVSAIAPTSLGILLVPSASALVVMKYIGAAYLVYLGIKLWRAWIRIRGRRLRELGFGKCFFKRLSPRLTNPKVIFFFLSMFPRLIDASNYAKQFLPLLITYSALVVVIHCFYACTAQRAKVWLASGRVVRTINRTGGETFLFFDAALVVAKKNA